MRNDLGYYVKYFLSPDIENIFFELLLPNTKTNVFGIIYPPPSRSEILEIINTLFSKLDSNNIEIYIYNINLYLDNSCVFQKSNLL